MISVSLIASHRLAVERFRLNQLNLVREVSAQIAHTLSVNELAQRVTELIQQTFHYYYVALFTLQDDLPSLRFRSSAGAARNGKRKRKIVLDVQFGQGLIGEAAVSGERVLVEDVRNDPRYRFIDGLPETRSEVVLPLKIEGRVLGVLDVQSNQPDGFHPNDLLILEALADTISRAIEGARLYMDLRRRANQLTLIAEVSKSVSSSLDLYTLMENVADLIHDRFGYPHVNLFTVHPNRRLIAFVAGSGERKAGLSRHTLSLDDAQGIIPSVAREGQTILANDVKKDKRYRPSPLPPENTRSELCVPLIYHTQVVGVLDIQSDRLNAFTQDDRFIFEAVADKSYPISRELYVYVKNAHVGVIPGLKEYVTEYMSDRASGEETLTPASGLGAEATEAGSVVGTPAYLSPEQAAGALDELGPAADIFSLGATLYEVLTGQAPYTGGKAVALGNARRWEFAPPRRVKSEVPAALEAVCLKAMARRPEDRYASPRLLADDVEHWLADEAVTGVLDEAASTVPVGHEPTVALLDVAGDDDGRDVGHVGAQGDGGDRVLHRRHVDLPGVQQHQVGFLPGRERAGAVLHPGVVRAALRPVREVLHPRVRAAELPRPSPAVALRHRQLDRLEPRVVAEVRHHLRRAAGRARRDAVQRDRAARPRVDEAERFGEGRRRPVDLAREADQVVFGLVDESGASTDVRRHLTLQVHRHIVRVRLRDVGIELNGARQGRRRRVCRLLAKLKAAIGIAIGPRIRDALVVLIGVGVAADARSWIVPEQPVAGLQHRSSIARQVVSDADPRAHRIPREERLLREDLLGNAHRTDAERDLTLFRHPAAITIPARAEVQELVEARQRGRQRSHRIRQPSGLNIREQFGGGMDDFHRETVITALRSFPSQKNATPSGASVP